MSDSEEEQKDPPSDSEEEYVADKSESKKKTKKKSVKSKKETNKGKKNPKKSKKDTGDKKKKKTVKKDKKTQKKPKKDSKKKEKGAKKVNKTKKPKVPKEKVVKSEPVSNFSKPGQRYMTPPQGDSTRGFYESLYEENPNSLIAIKFCVEYGVFGGNKLAEVLTKYTNLQKNGHFKGTMGAIKPSAISFLEKLKIKNQS